MKNKLTVFSSKMLPPRDDIRVEFTGRNLTKFGGIPLLRKFLIRFGVGRNKGTTHPFFLLKI